VVLQKGASDYISDGSTLPALFTISSSSSSSSDSPDTLIDSTPGGLKRVGGQGDILSGTVGALLAWGREWARGAYTHVGAPADDNIKPHVAILAAYGASAFSRTVSRRGWEARGRSMVTHDLVDLVGPVFEDMYGDKEARGKL
jgi:ATP-dependent NAD(P)H-hydrate dehydratase